MKADGAKHLPSGSGKPDKQTAARAKDDAEACSTCGREAVMVIDGTGWCESCLHARGSCCAESEMGDDD